MTNVDKPYSSSCDENKVPIRYDALFSASNARFDGWLKARDPHSGIKDFEHHDTLAREGEMVLIQDHEMPVNKRVLV